MFAHENGCSWNKLICNDTALHGHLNCLKYLHQNGCQWDAEFVVMHHLMGI